MVVQKGGQLHNETFTEYFKNIFELVHYLILARTYTREEFNKKIDSINKQSNILFVKLIDELNTKLTSNKIDRKIKRNLFLIIFRYIVKFINEESFIAKLLNIYIYMLFINYLITRTENGSKKNGEMLDFIHLISEVTTNTSTSSHNKSYYSNMNRKLTNMRKSFNIPNDFARNDFLRQIKELFIENYSSRVPILYGNDYVGNLSKVSKKYIINPVGAFILKLYISNIGRYKRRLLHLLQSVIGSDKIPNLKYLDNGTEFCIIKEQNHEKICEQVRDCSGSRVSNFFRSSLYGNRMIAEITEENIASDEHILELLDILLNLFLENNEILRTNINRNEVQQFNLSQRRPKTLSNQRRRFAEGAQSKVSNNINF